MQAFGLRALHPNQVFQLYLMRKPGPRTVKRPSIAIELERERAICLAADGPLQAWRLQAGAVLRPLGDGNHRTYRLRQLALGLGARVGQFRNRQGG
jgi:hypothetical protein